MTVLGNITASNRHTTVTVTNNLVIYHVKQYASFRWNTFKVLAQHRCVQPATVLNWLYFRQYHLAHGKVFISDF